MAYGPFGGGAQSCLLADDSNSSLLSMLDSAVVTVSHSHGLPLTGLIASLLMRLRQENGVSVRKLSSVGPSL